MKVIIADLFSEKGKAQLEEAKWEIVYNKDLKEDSLKAELESFQPEVLVVRSTKVPAELIDANANLKLIIRAGAGFDTIDFNHAASKGIKVANCPGKNATAVAELCIGLMITVDRRLAENYTLLQDGKWKKGAFAKCKGLKGRTLGLVGLGFVSKKVATIALAMGMNVIAFDPSGATHDGVTNVASNDEIAAQADIISLHCPSIEGITKGMINAEFLGKLKPDAVLINTA